MLDAAYLKTRFFSSVVLENEQGQPYPDSNLTHAVEEAKSFFRRKFGVLFARTLVKVGNIEASAPSGELPVLQTSGIDYDPKAFYQDRWSAMTLPYGPIKSHEDILKVEIGLGGYAQPSILEFKRDWFQLSERRYMLRLYPGYTSLSAHRISSFHLSILAGERRIPNAWRIAYVAGFENLEEEAPDLAHAIAMHAAIAELPFVAAFTQGLVSSESVSVDGLSQSRSLPVSGQTHSLSPLQSALEARLGEFLSTYFAQVNGPRIYFL